LQIFHKTPYHRHTITRRFIPKPPGKHLLSELPAGAVGGFDRLGSPERGIGGEFHEEAAAYKANEVIDERDMTEVAVDT